MRFLATLLGVILIIFGTFLIPFPDYQHFNTQQVHVTIKKVDSAVTAENGEQAKKEEKKSEEAATEDADTDEEKAKEVKVMVNGKKAGVISVNLDPIIGVISLLIGVVLVFMGRKSS